MAESSLPIKYVIKPQPKSYTGIKNILILKLQALKGQDGGDLFTAVYGVNKTSSEGYPHCYVLERAGKGQILDTARNQREWQFDVVIHQEIGTKTPEAAYAALLDASDKVISMLDQDPMLKDEHGQEQCMAARVVPVSFEYTEQETSVQRALLTVAVVDVVNRYLAP